MLKHKYMYNLLSEIFFKIVLKNVQNVINIGIKHCFSCIYVCQVPREVLKTSASVCNTSLGTWQTLMYWKTMFDRCYCIISTKYSVTFVALYFVNV